MVVWKPDCQKPVYGPKCPVFKWSAKSCDFFIWILDNHTVQYSGVGYSDGYCILNSIKMPVQWELEYQIFEFRTHLKSKHFGVGIWDGSVLEWSSCGHDHSKTEPVQRNPRWQLFGQIWNGQAIQFWNAVWNQSHSTSDQLSTIQNQHLFGIQAHCTHIPKQFEALWWYVLAGFIG